MVVDEAPGTTRDSISMPFDWRGQPLTVADTAGIRKRASGGARREELDRMAVLRALQTIEHSHVALLMIDADVGLRRQDKVIAAKIVQHCKSCVLVGNKADLLDDRGWEAFEEQVKTELPMLAYAPLVRASVLHGNGIDEAMELVVEAGRWRRERLPKRTLNEIFADALLTRPLPRSATGGAQKIRYVAQAETETPTFVFHMNREVRLHPGDEKYLENTIRAQWSYTATPLRLVFKAPDPNPRSPDMQRRRAKQGTRAWTTTSRSVARRSRLSRSKIYN